MNTRRDFLKKAALLSANIGVWSAFPPSIQKALDIIPEEGSTFYDAEHVVFLMQENRSFDHCFGSLKGVRGFNDPRAIRLHNDNPVWLQSNKEGETYMPFRLNIKDTKATWMGGLPHAWENQVDARNNGKYDNWLEAKRPGYKDFQDMPLTLGHYTRPDLPFYYSLADGFTVFDQHFCSSLTGTTSNRMFLWSGKLRATPDSQANVRNSDVYYNSEVNWKTFPERLEENGISWRVYQNEISLQTGLKGEESSLLSNFTDNNLEWFSQYNVRFSQGHQNFLKKRKTELPTEITALENQVKRAAKHKTQALRNKIEHKKRQLASIEKDLEQWSAHNFEALSTFHKNLHEKAFTTNINDQDYHQTETLTYTENDQERTVKVPKSDILYQFRKDVDTGNLPTVSWLVAPQKFSDHPGAPWYGAWYVSEIMDILTKDPEVFKKTIFIVTYDENDGYFDHVPPFVAPHPSRTNAVSEGIDTSTEFVTLKEELNKEGLDPENARESPVGLGYRVPMLVVSPWTKGGRVNSEVCDISSTLMFLEKFIAKKTGKQIKETNISSWRRAISGDLRSAFRPYNGEELKKPNFLERDEFVKEIYNASFKEAPANFEPLSNREIREIRKKPLHNSLLPKQEPGIKDSCALNYELYVEAIITEDKKDIELNFTAANQQFKEEALSAPFHVYAPEKFHTQDKQGDDTFEAGENWSFAVRAGDTIKESWPIEKFKNNTYLLRTYGPNGFFREIKGDSNDPKLKVSCKYQKARGFFNKLSGACAIKLENFSEDSDYDVVVSDKIYKDVLIRKRIPKNSAEEIIVPTKKSYGWYDFTVTLEESSSFKRQYAGRVETGKDSKTDPYMGKEI